MPDSFSRRGRVVPNGGPGGEIDLLLDHVCSRLRNDFTRQLVRDVVRLKLEMGFESDVRDYLKKRSGEYPAYRKPGSDS